MRVQVLMSCMNLQGFEIVEKSKIKSDVLIVNQCGEEKLEEKTTDGYQAIKYSTTERGLSRSRNMAINKSDADICILCDDDECFVEGYAEKVEEAFQKYADADIIIWDMANWESKFNSKMQYLKFPNILKVSSCQISFRREKIKEQNLSFNVHMGAGTGNGAGEENKFLLDCIKSGLKVLYLPEKIAFVAQEESTWFDGYNEKFFFQRGAATRYMLGVPLAFLYAVYYVVVKRKLYRGQISMVQAFRYILKGMKANTIACCESKG